MGHTNSASGRQSCAAFADANTKEINANAAHHSGMNFHVFDLDFVTYAYAVYLAKRNTRNMFKDGQVLCKFICQDVAYRGEGKSQNISTIATLLTIY